MFTLGFYFHKTCFQIIKWGGKKMKVESNSDFSLDHGGCSVVSTQWRPCEHGSLPHSSRAYCSWFWNASSLLMVRPQLFHVDFIVKAVILPWFFAASLFFLSSASIYITLFHLKVVSMYYKCKVMELFE